MNDEELEEIRERHRRFADVPFEIESHTHLEDGCRCLSCLVFLGVQISVGTLCEELPDAGKAYGKGCDQEVLTSAQAQYLLDARRDVGRLLEVIEEMTRARRLVKDQLERMGPDCKAPYPADTYFWVEWKSDPGSWVKYSSYRFPDSEGAHEANRRERELVPSFQFRVVQSTTVYAAEVTE